MTRLDKADTKLKDFITKWKDFYKLSDGEMMHLLSKTMYNTTITKDFQDSKIDKVPSPPKQDENNLIKNITYVVAGDDLKGIAYLKINDELVYVDKNIDKFIEKVRMGKA